MSLRWAVVGPGRIAEKFVEAVQRDGDHADGGGSVVAVSSRSQERGRAWADQHGIARAHEGLDELAADDEVEAWYVASPHMAHVEQVVAAARAGVHVLVEKPFAVTAAGVERAQTACREAGVALVEAMWTRFLPVYDDVRGWLADGRIGMPMLVDARLGFVAQRDHDDRLLNPDLAGGAILDTGVYPLGLAQMVFGDTAEAMHVVGHVGETGVDEQALFLLSYPGGAGATLTATLTAVPERSAMIAGSGGRILVHERFHGATSATLMTGDGGETETVERPFDVNGFEYQVRAMHRLVADGGTEAAQMTWADSLGLARQMDEARRQLGVVLPMDDADPAV